MRLSKAELETRQRLKDDFTHYASRCLWIRPKEGAVARLQLNRPQIYLHQRLEAQLALKGKIRALILKGRQQGCSTLIQGRYYWKASHRFGVRVFILTHKDEATANLFAMAKRFHDRSPALVRPKLQRSNAKELVFSALDSSYRVSTAGSSATGRSDTIQYFHGSEVAYWPNAEEHVKGVMQAIPNAAGTEVILESTSAGPMGLFHDYCQAAIAGEGEYELIFIPWFWSEEYTLPVPEGFQPTEEERELKERFGIDDTHLVWRRGKVVELMGAHHFRREYPFTAEEAFKAEQPGALWKRHQLDGARVRETPPMRRVVVAIDPSGGDGEGNNECGIVVVGLGENGRGYVLDDRSGKYSPNGWGSAAVAAYHRWKADRVVAEQNFGGDMVKALIQTIDPKVPYKAVTASRGKQVRAEPVAALYEQGMVSHAGEFIALEDEMTTWDPILSEFSPNRIDALVWGITEIMLGGRRPSPMIGVHSETGPSKFYGR